MKTVAIYENFSVKRAEGSEQIQKSSLYSMLLLYMIVCVW